MEAFLLPVSPAHQPGEYVAFEVNRAGRAIVSRTRFRRQFDFHWQTALCKEKETLGGGGADAAAQVAAAVTYDDGTQVVFAFSVVLADLGLEVARLEAGTQRLRLLLARATRADDSGADMAWASWVDPGDDAVDFHRPETFGSVQFLG
jgi:hypothetical protein